MPALITGFCSMKRLGVFLLPLDGILVHCRLPPSILSGCPQEQRRLTGQGSISRPSGPKTKSPKPTKPVCLSVGVLEELWGRRKLFACFGGDVALYILQKNLVPLLLLNTAFT